MDNAQETTEQVKQQPTGLGYSDGLPIQQTTVEQREIKKVQPTIAESLMIVMSVAEYIRHFTGRGQDFITIDKERADSIRSQADWEKAVYIEEINESTCYRLFSLDVWLHRKTNLPELKQESIAEKHKQARDYHAKLAAWKIEAFRKLITKVDTDRANHYIKGMLNPKDVVKQDKYTDVEGHLNEVEYNKAVGFYYKLREKLNFPIMTTD